jgi:DNA-binding transcriptional MerR regulator
MPDAPEGTRDLFQIGEAAERAGLSLRTVRLYEEMGLVRPSARSKGGFRLFSEKDVQRLLVLKGMKPMGLSLEQMREVAGVLDRTEAPQSLETHELAASTDDLVRLVELSEQRIARLDRHMAEARKLAQRIADRAAVCCFELERRGAGDSRAASSGSG